MQTSLFENIEPIEARQPALRQADVMPSAFVYRFTITSNQNNRTLGTGLFKSSLKMTKEEQISFFHKYTHGQYLRKESFVTIDVFEAEA